MRTLSTAAPILVVLGVACSAAPKPKPPRGEIVLEVTGKVENGPFRFGADDVPALPQRSIRGRHPGAAEAATFQGASLADLLAEGMALDRRADTAVVRSRDGYAAAVPIVVLRQFKPALADRADGRPLAEWAASAGVRARPFLLAWPNVEYPGLSHDPRARGFWVDGVSEVEVVAWSRTYGWALRVPTGAPDEARIGASAFQVRCMPCHALRGVGGRRGPELTRAAERGADAFAARLRPHADEVRPVVGPDDPDEDALRQIAEFLAAVAVSAPAEETGPEGKPGEEEEREPPPPTRGRPGPRRP